MLSLVDGIIAAQDQAVRSRLVVAAPPDLASIDLDAQMMELALLQLIDNAAKYSNVGQKIDVTIEQSDLETTVIVSNDGSPIPPHEQELIFERFYRGVDSVHGPSGTGLGLSIVKKTAEAHGGRVWVECENNRSRFFVTVGNYRGTTNG